ncbi:hypothetical protein SAMN05216276_10676 [Streptosporangium subroseum]|uniref:Uncharacterized protein n=1 Tax=Streptosporangium subroseum TaxID=106412 RepID=A0A239NS59_9ACTN|nr:hypothetical protein [Streptosporangium subroseum]SNT57522.1 hypothetical protein SAMN05216276_10676 [Streptosporangium subroseum]
MADDLIPTKGPTIVPELTGSPRRTAVEILAIWPSATMAIDNSNPVQLFVVLKEWENSLPREPPAPTENDLDEGFDEQQWYEYHYNERRIPLHLATDEWMPAEIAERFGTPDNGCGLDYFPAEYLYPLEKQDEIEQALRDLGFTVVRDHLLRDGAFLDRWLS